MFMTRKYPMHKIRWGLCCIFKEAPIKFRTATVAYIARLNNRGEPYLNFLSTLILSNLNTLIAAIEYCKQFNIGSFRIHSEFLPLFKHFQYGYHLEQLPEAALIFQKFEYCKKLAQTNTVRLTFHPDQFVVLNSPHEHVVKNSIQELEYHGEIAELLGADVINIHAGGTYGNKAKALTNFAERFERLSKRVRTRLTIENDDRCFTPQDLLSLCQQLKIPLVYDVHHHRCLPDELSIEQASIQAYKTWDREPLFHISSPLEGWNGPKRERHHDYIDIQDFPICWFDFPAMTIEIEAKAKELAIFKLQTELDLKFKKIKYEVD
ncbi:Uncharacterized protein PRO82_001866 [Candidatus Protochlamydia amoebophila]|nr:Uncharacterized protein [Candidatus Protochlamydia amoebophila]